MVHIYNMFTSIYIYISLWSVHIAAGHIMFLYDSKHGVPVWQRARSLWQAMDKHGDDDVKIQRRKNDRDEL